MEKLHQNETLNIADMLNNYSPKGFSSINHNSTIHYLCIDVLQMVMVNHNKSGFFFNSIIIV